MSTETIILLLVFSVFTVIVQTKGARDPECSLPLETGLCRARMPRWGFDTAKQRCREFVWGGCGKYGNSFETEEECNAKCGDRLNSVEAERDYVTVTGTCNCQCPKCEKIPHIERTGRGFPLFLSRFFN